MTLKSHAACQCLPTFLTHKLFICAMNTGEMNLQVHFSGKGTLTFFTLVHCSVAHVAISQETTCVQLDIQTVTDHFVNKMCRRASNIHSCHIFSLKLRARLRELASCDQMKTGRDIMQPITHLVAKSCTLYLTITN